VSAPRRHQQWHMVPFSRRGGHRIFFRSCRLPACPNVFQSRQHAAGSHRWCDVFARAARGRYLRQQPRNAAEIPEGSTLPDREEGIMTMSEYEERFPSSTLSLHQTFAEARGFNRGRLCSRPFWLAAALLGVMSMTMNAVSHHTIQSGQVTACNYASPASDDPLAAIRGSGFGEHSTAWPFRRPRSRRPCVDRRSCTARP